MSSHLLNRLLMAILAISGLSAAIVTEIPDTTATSVRSDTPFPEYGAKLKEIQERNQQASDDFIHSTSNLVPALFWLLNDAYREGGDTSIIQALHSLSYCSDLTIEQFQSIRQQVLKLLDQPAIPLNLRQMTKEERADYAFLQGALEVLARHPEADTEDILLHALDRPNDEYVNHNAAKALQIFGSERGLKRVQELWESSPPDSFDRRNWKIWMDRIAAAVAAKKEAKASSSTPSAIASNPYGGAGKEPIQKPAPPPLAEVRSSALAWVGGVVGGSFLLILLLVHWLKRR